MEHMEVDGMDMDGPDEAFDEQRRQRAAQKLNKQLGKGSGAAPDQSGMSYGQAKDLMTKLSVLYTGNKITVDNAFDLNGIEALRALIFHDRSADSRVKCAEGHFQAAGAGLDISMKIYAKRVDAVYNLTYKSLEAKPPGRNDDDEDGEDKSREAAKGAEGAEGGDEDGEARGPGGAKGGRRRQATADVQATLLKRKDGLQDDGDSKDSEPKQRGKEPSFDNDPFFVRTSRLIDENSPQGLLLHNLPVLKNGNIAFDASTRLLEAKLPSEAEADAMVDILVDLTVLPGARELLGAASRACISPGMEELYGMLKEEAEQPGLKAAAKVDPHDLLRAALAENKRERLDAQRNAIVRQVVRQVEDAMDVDMADAADGGGDADTGDAGPGPGYDDDLGPGPDADYLGEEAGAGPTSSPGFGSPGGGLAGGWDDDAAYSPGEPGSDREDARERERDQEARDDDVEGAGGQSDDDSAVFSLISRLTGLPQSGSTVPKNNWWKSYTKKTTAEGTAASKLRARRQKPEEVPVDWRGPAPGPDLEEAHMHTYKTARREASAKLCLPPSEPACVEQLYTFFSAMPLRLGPVGACGSSSRPQGFPGLGAGAGTAYDVQEAWRLTLMAEKARERQLRRDARDAGQQPHRGAATPAGGRATGFGGGPTFSGVSGPGYDAAGGDEYGSGGYDADHDNCGDAGPMGADSPDASDEDDDDDGGDQAGFRDTRAPTLEELLQPPRRVRRLPVKYDKTAGVADVATLKANIEESLKYLVITDDPASQREAADQPPGLPFQTVLDRVPVTAAERKAPAKGAFAAAGAEGRGGGGGGDPLAGVSTHLAFICLLHLANEKGLALANSGNLDTLVITGLGDLARLGGRTAR